MRSISIIFYLMANIYITFIYFYISKHILHFIYLLHIFILYQIKSKVNLKIYLYMIFKYNCHKSHEKNYVHIFFYYNIFSLKKYSRTKM